MINETENGSVVHENDVNQAALPKDESTNEFAMETPDEIPEGLIWSETLGNDFE